MADNQEFVRSIENATLKIINNVVANMRTATLLLEGEAKKECPVDMGALRASMYSKVNLNDREIVGIVGNTLKYSVYVHQGTGLYAVNGDGRKTPWRYKSLGGKYKGWHYTKGQAPNPFLDRAKLANRDKIARILGGK